MTCITSVLKLTAPTCSGYAHKLRLLAKGPNSEVFWRSLSDGFWGHCGGRG